MRSSVFIKTWSGDLQWIPWVLRFLKKYWLTDSEFLISAPADCTDTLKPMSDILGKPIVLIPIEQWPDNPDIERRGWVHQQFVKHNADVYCQGDYITFIDSDCILVKPTDFDQHLMIGDKPVMWYTEYDKIHTPWRGWVNRILCIEPPYEFMRSFPLTYHKSTLAKCREHIEMLHAHSLNDIMYAERCWTEFNILGFYAYVFQKNLYEWKNTYDHPMYETEIYRHDRVRQFHNVYDWNAGTEPYLKEMYGESIPQEIIEHPDAPKAVVEPKTAEPVIESIEQESIQVVSEVTETVRRNVDDSFIKIGIIDQTTKGWAAGSNFTQMMLSCLGLASSPREEIVFMSRSMNQDDLKTSFERVFIGYHPTEGYAKFSSWKELIQSAKCDIILPVRDKTSEDMGATPFVGWIPDFQHKILPTLFENHDILERDRVFSQIIHQSRLLLLSSQCAFRDLQSFCPQYADKARVVNFSSMLWNMDRQDPGPVLDKYRIPRKFVLVSNQFWRHKNHQILPRAFGILKRKGMVIDLVLTGVPADYRDLDGSILSSFFQNVIREDISSSVHFLGQVPYPDLVTLMRCSSLIIQPSFFEGWSTSIEDSKALGRPVICSDIPVHREQIPEALGFFDPDNPKSLAAMIESIYPELPQGPDCKSEEINLEAAKIRCRNYGLRLLEIARESLG